MTSSRYAIPVAILVSLALIPTVIHNYLGLTAGDTLSVNRIQTVLDNFSGEPSQRKQGWAEDAFGSYDWFERFYRDEHGKPLRLFVGQSFDHKRLYHHPDLALSYAKDMRGNGMVWLNDGKDEIPVHLLKNETRPFIVGYVLLYDGKFVANPIAHQLQDSISLLVSPRKPMTLFYVADENAASGVAFADSSAATLLKKAIASFKAQDLASAK